MKRMILKNNSLWSPYILSIYFSKLHGIHRKKSFICMTTVLATGWRAEGSEFDSL
jgi:hypothetical protein